MPSPVRPALLALVAAVALAGCGASDEDSAGDFSGEERLVANTIEDLADAGRENDGTEICSLLSERLVATVRRAAAGDPCADAIEDAVRDADSFDIDVVDVTVDGTAASAVIESTANDEEIRETFGLVKQGPRWVVDALGSGPRG